MEVNSQTICTGMWGWLQGTGLERFEFVRAGNEWIFHGTILTFIRGAAAEARYESACNRTFHTRRAHISLRNAAGERTLQITAENGRWYQNGSACHSVRGAIDIDLGWSPSTNTLPIRRLELEVGKSSGPVTAAWVRFPEVTLEPLPQEYLRVSERLYRYSSLEGTFIAQLSVDDEGLVLDYEGFWQRMKS
jgi:uncharacterized protein